MLDIIFEDLKEIIANAGKLLLQQEIVINSHKTINDLLTENDLLIEQYIINNVLKKYPDLNIISEENNPTNKLKGYTLIIDPIDGTCNYALGLNLFGLQIALFNDLDCQYSMLYFPVQDEMIYAIKDKGCYVNGKRVYANKNIAASSGILIISDYYRNITPNFEKQFEIVKSLQNMFLKTRHLGAACYDFSVLAKSNAAGYICYYSNIWDIAPGLLIAKEAGCVYCNIYGNEYKYGEAGLVVANNIDNLNIILSTIKENI